MGKLFEHLRTPDFGRLRTALLCGQPDAIPVIELGIHPTMKETLLGRPVLSVSDDIEIMSRLGYDFIKIQPRIKFDLQRQVAVNAGNASPDRAWASEHEGVIQTMEDFEKYPWPTPESIDYSGFEEARRLLPDGMGLIGQYGDIFTTAWEMMGFENFAMALYEDPELVDALFEKIGGLILGMFRNMAAMDWVDALWYSDDIAYTGGLMVSPDFLRAKHFPNLAVIGDLARARNIPFLYHSDGVLWDVFNDILAAGVTSQHPIEPKSMEIGELKKAYAGRLALCGNIDVDLLSRGTPEQVRALTLKRIEEIGPGGGYALGSSNSIPEYVRPENYLAMLETALVAGKY